MRYFVPQIQHQTKIGGLSLQQAFFVIIGVIISLVAFFSSPVGGVIVFIPTMAIVLFLSFGSIKGIAIPIFLKNWFAHLSAPKEYHWKKQAIISKEIQIKYEEPKIESKKREATLVQKKSKLYDLSQKTL
jgi:hypothetical protein